MSTSLSLKKRTSEHNPRQIRRDGYIPVTIYGKNLEQSISLQISKVDFFKLGLSTRVQSIEGEVEGQQKHLLVIKSIEKNPVTDEVYNVQFQSVAPEDLVNVTVPLRYEGTSPLVQAGGILYVNKKSVDLLCPAQQIPAYVAYNLNNLNSSKSIAHYSDLQMEQGLVLSSDSKQIIAKVSAPSIQTETAAAKLEEAKAA